MRTFILLCFAFISLGVLGSDEYLKLRLDLGNYDSLPEAVLQECMDNNVFHNDEILDVMRGNEQPKSHYKMNCLDEALREQNLFRKEVLHTIYSFPAAMTFLLVFLKLLGGAIKRYDFLLGCSFGLALSFLIGSISAIAWPLFWCIIGYQRYRGVTFQETFFPARQA